MPSVLTETVVSFLLNRISILAEMSSILADFAVSFLLKCLPFWLTLLFHLEINEAENLELKPIIDKEKKPETGLTDTDLQSDLASVQSL